MELIPIHSTAVIQIKSVEDDRVNINDQVYRHSVIVLPDRIIDPWSVSKIENFSIDDAQVLRELKPEVLLIGTGRELNFPAAEILAWFNHHHIGAEFMDTRAACRTFQLLTSENRKVVAALLFA